MNKCIIITGANGYIGNAVVQRFLNKNYKVVFVDNFLKKIMINEMKSFSAIPQISFDNKMKIFQKDNKFFNYNFNIVNQIEELDKCIKLHHPDVILNLAHIPSGPYSQISRDNANLTLTNNIIGTNNILWSIKENCPDCRFICIGTTGEYDHYSNIDIEEGYFQIKHKGRLSKEMIYPRRPSSVYHTSKVSSTYLIDFLCRTWNLRCTDIQQSVVFGAYTDEIDKSKVYSEFHSDEAFGTVLNRFIVQSVLDVPLTIYGEGKHQRGFLSLNDSVQAIELLVDNETDDYGKVRSINQLSSWCSMNNVANMVIDVGKKFNLNIKSSHISTPRNEYTGDHYYKYITKNLTDLGYVPTRTIKQEIEYVFKLLLPLKEKLLPLKEIMIPKIKWGK